MPIFGTITWGNGQTYRYSMSSGLWRYTGVPQTSISATISNLFRFDSVGMVTGSATMLNVPVTIASASAVMGGEYAGGDDRDEVYQAPLYPYLGDQGPSGEGYVVRSASRSDAVDFSKDQILCPTIAEINAIDSGSRVFFRDCSATISISRVGMRVTGNNEDKGVINQDNSLNNEVVTKTTSSGAADGDYIMVNTDTGTIHIRAKSGAYLEGLTIDGVAIELTPDQQVNGYEHTFTTMNALHTIALTWGDASLIATERNNNKGTVSGISGDDLSGFVVAPNGSSQTVIATPDADSFVISVTINGETEVVNSNVAVSRTFDNVVSDQSISFEFGAKPKITTSVDGSGSITPVSMTADYDSSPQFTINADVGYAIVAILVNDVEQEISDRLNEILVIENITEDTHIHAIFKASGGNIYHHFL